jgi:hypothetical protein
VYIYIKIPKVLTLYCKKKTWADMTCEKMYKENKFTIRERERERERELY